MQELKNDCVTVFVLFLFVSTLDWHLSSNSVCLCTFPGFYVFLCVRAHGWWTLNL